MARNPNLPFTEASRQVVREAIAERVDPLEKRVTAQISELTEQTRANADEFRDNYRKFTEAQEYTNRQLHHIESSLDAIQANTKELVEETRRSAASLTAAIAALTEKLNPK